MKYVCTHSFKDGYDNFEKGETLSTQIGQGCRVVTEDKAEYFRGNGWASREGDVPSLNNGVASTEVNAHNVEVSNHG